MRHHLRLYFDRLDTPIGRLLVVADGDGRLRVTHWSDEEASLLPVLHRQNAPELSRARNSTQRVKFQRSRVSDAGRGLRWAGGPLDDVALEPAANPGGVTAALRAYFDGNLAAIDRLPVETGGTAFQRAVWTALRDIPCGTTVSYAALARRIDRPSAVRAVGLANGANPVAIVLPCHRVIGANGTLTGYGGGLERKRWLLSHEAGETMLGGWAGRRVGW